MCSKRSLKAAFDPHFKKSATKSHELFLWAFFFKGLCSHQQKRGESQQKRKASVGRCFFAALEKIRHITKERWKFDRTLRSVPIIFTKSGFLSASLMKSLLLRCKREVSLRTRAPDMLSPPLVIISFVDFVRFASKQLKRNEVGHNWSTTLWVRKPGEL